MITLSQSRLDTDLMKPHYSAACVLFPLLLTPLAFATAQFETHKVRDLGRTNSQCVNDTRSRWDIIWSCLATIFACTWIAVHPNIPSSQDGIWKIFKTRAIIMFYALVTPEFIIGWATNQWLSARMIERRHKVNHKWTKTHAHFMQMGGFILYSSSGEPIQVLNILDLEVLESVGAIDWPIMTSSDIEDRSKGDFLSKTLVVLQTSWFIAQCIARGCQGLNVTELELVTLAFATLNGIMYFLWWDKPLDVRFGEKLYLKKFTNDMVIVLLRSQQRFCSPDDRAIRSDLVFASKDDEADMEKCISPIPVNEMTQSVATTDIDQEVDVTPEPRSTARQKNPHPLLSLLSWIPANWRRLQFNPFVTLMDPLFDMVIPRYEDFDDRLRVPTFYFDFIPTSLNLYRRISFQFLINVPGIAMLFGAVHCIAWSPLFQFPSDIEAIIWRTSATVMVVIPVIFGMIAYVRLRFRPRFQPLPRFPLASLLLLYFAARFILLVQPLVLLRDLPPGAYQTVQWTQFMPHI